MKDQDTTVEQLKAFVDEFVSEREWQQFHDPKNLAMAMSIEVSELMEHFQWVRSESCREYLEDSDHREQVVEEIADVFCYVLAFATTAGVDLADALERKMVKNRLKYPVRDWKGKA